MLLRINPSDMTVTEFETPNDKSQFQEIVTTSDNKVWYADFAFGTLESFDPRTSLVTKQALPGGSNSQPLGLAVDRDDRIWIVETGNMPNRLIGFDSKTATFLTETDIPSGAGSVSHMHYYEPTGEIWFGTSTNYIGRADIH